MPQALRCLIADDHELVRESLVEYLRHHWQDIVIAEVGSFPEVMGRLSTGDGFDLVLLDLGMPGGGIGSVAEVVRLAGPGRVVILSGTTDRATVLECLGHGAAGFIPKAIRGQIMLNAVRLVLSGETFVPAMILAQADDPRTSSNPTLDALSERERDVLAQLASGQSNKAIGRALDIEEVTVKLHLRRIFKKIDVANRTQAAQRAVEWGLGKPPGRR